MLSLDSRGWWSTMRRVRRGCSLTRPRCRWQPLSHLASSWGRCVETACAVGKQSAPSWHIQITHIYIQQQTWNRLSQPGAPAVISALLHQVYTREFVVQLEACGQVLLWLAGDPGRQKKLMHGCKIVLLPLVSAAEISYLSTSDM